MKVLMLLTDAYGAYGGIAKYNRDLLGGLAVMTEISLVTVLPRVVQFAPLGMPKKIEFLEGASKGNLSYLINLCRTGLGGNKIVICGHINLLPIAFLVALFNNAKLLLTIHGIEVWQPHKSWLVNMLIKRVDMILSVSAFTRKKLTGWSGIDEGNVSILPNSIDISNYGVRAKRGDMLLKHNLVGKRVLLTLGRLSADEKYKGIDEVLDVMPSLIEIDKNIVYVVAGDGSDRVRLEKKAADLGIIDNVRFIGFVEESDKPDCFSLADVFVMVGYGEGFGIVYLEAMACGVPVVASRVDGSYEAVRNGRLGAAVDPRNPVEIRSALLNALCETAREVPAGLKYFSYERFKNRLHILFKKNVFPSARP